MKVILFCLLLPAVMFATGCEMDPGQHRVEVLLPPMPETWDDRDWADGFRLVYRNGDGDMVERVYPAGAGGVSILLPRKTNQPVLVYPAGALVPAGGVFPWDLNDDEVLMLSWNHGWTALLLFRLSSAGEVCRAVNVRRLLQEVQVESDGDPWKLDMEYALRSLSYGRFSVYDLAPLRLYEPVIPALPGTWFSENPFHEPLRAGEEGFLPTGTVTEGFHRYRSTGGGKIDVWLYEEGWTWLNRLTGDAESGTW